MLLDTEKPDLVAITETKIDSEFLDSEITRGLDYNIWRKDRNKFGGGILLLISSAIMADFPAANTRCTTELLFVDLTFRNFSLRIAVTYLPPHCDAFQGAIVDDLTILGQSAEEVVLIGDFNMPDVDWSVYSSNVAMHRLLVLELLNLGFVQLIDKPTRFRPPNILGLLLVTNGNLVQNWEILPPIATSDHATISFSIRACFHNKRVWKQNFFKMDKEMISWHLVNIDWVAFYWENSNSFPGHNIVEKFWLVLKSLLLQLINMYVPWGQNESFPLFWPRSLRTLADARQKAFKTWTRDFDFHAHFRYLEFTQLFNKTLKKFQIEYEKKLISGGSKKAFYRYISSKTKPKFSIPNLTVNNRQCKTKKDKCQALNDHFASVYTIDDGNLPPLDFYDNMHVESQSVLQFDVLDIYEILSKLKHTMVTGPDSIPYLFYHTFAAELSFPLYFLMTFVYQFGYVPRDWKDANITAIYKNKGSKSEVGNYRDISILSGAARPLDYLLNKTLSSHFTQNNLWASMQHGFLPGRSTVTNLLYCMNSWSAALDSGECVDIIYFDFKKAFNSVVHEKLFFKLSQVGISGKLLGLIKSFVFERRQRVRLDDTFSNWSLVLSGVPQGSVIGPTLFLIYVNDVLFGEDAVMTMFADDAKLFKRFRKFEIPTLQVNVNVFCSWAHLWQLFFAENKCQYLCVGYHNPGTQYTVNSVPVEEVKEVKDLGVFISNNLKPHKHSSVVVKKAMRQLSLLRRNIASDDPQVLTELYQTYVIPLIEYASEVWNPKFKMDIDKIENVQHYFTRYIQGCVGLPYEERCSVLKLPTLELRRLAKDLIFTYKLLQGLTFLNPEEFFQLATESRTRGHSWKLYPKPFSCLARKYFFSISVVNYWNLLSESTVSAKSVNIFRKRVWEDLSVLNIT